MVAGLRSLGAAVGAFVLSCAPARAERIDGPARLTILHLSDLHSHLFELRERVTAADARRGLGAEGELARLGGVARLATLIFEARGRSERSLLIDSGDAVHGAAVYDAYGGAPELLSLSALGLDAHVLGNHDLESGARAAAERYRTFARFPVLAANAIPAGPSAAFDGVLRPFAVLEADGLRVALIGIGALADASAGADPAGLAARDAAEAAQAAIDGARPLADLVVLATHLGVEGDRALVRETSGADVVLGGHQHWLLDQPLIEHDCGARLRRARACRPRPVVIVHSGAYGKYLGVLELELERAARGPGADHGFEVVAHAYRAEPAHAGVPAHAGLIELLEPYAPLDADDLLGYAPSPLERFGLLGGDSALGNLVTSALAAELDAEIAILNLSTLRADVPAGLVTRATLEAALPFDDRPVEVWVAGVELDAIFARAAARTRERGCQASLAVAGARLRIDCASGSYALFGRGERCIAGTCGARAAGALRPLAMSDYLARGGSGYVVPERLLRGATAARSLAEAVRERIQRAPPCPELAGCIAEARPWLAARRPAPGERALAAAEIAVRAEALCARLPCLDANAGAARDGRVEVREGE